MVCCKKWGYSESWTYCHRWEMLSVNIFTEIAMRMIPKNLRMKYIPLLPRRF